MSVGIATSDCIEWSKNRTYRCSSSLAGVGLGLYARLILHFNITN